MIDDDLYESLEAGDVLSLLIIGPSHELGFRVGRALHDGHYRGVLKRKFVALRRADNYGTLANGKMESPVDRMLVVGRAENTPAAIREIPGVMAFSDWAIANLMVIGHVES